ncbi:hypothetical protein RB595_000709 [Gaeumannomyces hyphopodioides]
MGKSGSQKRRREAEAAQEQAAAVPLTDESTPAANSAPPIKKARVEERRSLFVRSLPTSATGESLTEFFSQHFPVKHATVVVDPKTKTSRGYGFVTFTDPDDAIQAKEKFNNELLDGRRLRLDIAEPRHRAATKAGVPVKTSKVAQEKQKREEEQAESRKIPKLIIRNLPWSIKSSEQLSALFQGFGKVKFADLPNDKGKLSGFGFVTLRGRKNAEAAIEKLNGKIVDGRPIAVDWAVEKSVWEQQAPETETPKKKSATKETFKEKKSDDEPKPKSSLKKGADDFDEDEDIRNFLEKNMETLESEDEDEDENEASDDGSSEKDEAEEDDEDDDDNEDGGVEVGDDKKKQPLSDNSSTLFIRNVPFTTTDEQLKEHFSQFGAVRYARVVMDHATQRPAGKGFVCFFNVEDAESCARNAPRYRPAPTLTKHSVLQDETVDAEGKYTLEGRVLQVSKAVSKNEAENLTSAAAAARNAQDKDKRRLFLLSEGQIPASSPVYSLLPASEIQMREASAKQRKKMIESNPSLHLSLTRLAIRNIPRNTTAKDLKALAREAVVGFAKDVKEGKRAPLSKEESRRGGQTDKDGEHNRKLKKKGIVLQAKIVFESKDGSKVSEVKSADEGARSRGYGFIEYSSHRWALMGARWLNGHSVNGATGKKATRLIVEFAIENANVVARRNATHERFKGQGPPTQNKPQAATDSRAASKDEQGSLEAAEGGKVTKSAEKKLAMRQQIIGRKRMMRKKKADMRRGK